MIRCTGTTRVLAAVVAIGVLVTNIARGEKGGKGGGSGGGSAAYTIVDLLGLPGGPGGGFQSSAVAVNEPDDAGDVFVVGNSHVAGTPRPAFWSVSGDGSFTVDDLGGLPPGASGASASDVNDLGVITLNAIGGDVSPAWVLVPGLPYQELPRLSSYARARAVNNSGQIVGNDGDLGALWQLDAEGAPGAPVDLGHFLPCDVSDDGVIAGQSFGHAAIAWFSTGGLQLLALGELPGHEWSQATAISGNGAWVLGVSWNANDREPFLWSRATGRMVGLRSSGGVNGEAFDVNNAGQVVGWTNPKGDRSSQAAFLWQNGAMVDLNSLAEVGRNSHLQIAYGINNAGHVVGIMRISRPVSEEHGFLLVPNEP